MKKIIIVIGLLVIHFILGLNTIKNLSPTYDEPLHLTSGYSYLKTGKYYLNIYDHPPLAEMFSAIPLLFYSPKLETQHPSWEKYEQYVFADWFLYRNRVSAEKMLNSGRLMILICSSLLGFMVYRWAKELYGVIPGLFALALYVFSPDMLAHGTLVTTDLMLTGFYFLTIYTFWHWMNQSSRKNAVLAGICCGLALCTKFSAIVLFGILGLILVLSFITKKIRVSNGKLFLHFTIFVVVLILVISVVYQFSSQGLYFEGLKRTLIRLGGGRSSFLLGQYSTTGWKHYFLTTFLVKTPIPLVIFTLIAFLVIIYNKKWNSDEMLFLLLPAGIYFLLASFSKTQIGHRHILIAYPFLIVLASGVLRPVTLILSEAKWKGLIFLIIPCLLIWYIFTNIKVHPWYISYFNEFIGGPQNGYNCLTDSNLDWGQGLKELGKYLNREKIRYVYLCYFGTGDPHYYNIKYVPIGFIDNLTIKERTGDSITVSKDDRIIFAISATNLKSTYYADKQQFGWLEKYKPVKVIAYSILVYDLTDNPEGLKELSKTLNIVGNYEHMEYVNSKIHQVKS